jgi:phosphoribosylanthranilate isomerase
LANKITGKQIKDADFDIKKVGVFVDPVIRNYWMPLMNMVWTIVQLHGNETPEMCEELSAEVEVKKSVSYSR